MDAYDCATSTPVRPSGEEEPSDGICFGVSPEQTAFALERLAGDIRAGRVLLSGVTMRTHARVDDFAQTRLMMSWTEKRALPRGLDTVTTTWIDR